MTYEEKRALHVEISQMLADAGLNQGEIKKMVLETIDSKVGRAVEQAIKKLNSESSDGDFCKQYIRKYLDSHYLLERIVRDAVKEMMKDRIVKVVLTNGESELKL